MCGPHPSDACPMGERARYIRNRKETCKHTCIGTSRARPCACPVALAPHGAATCAHATHTHANVYSTCATFLGPCRLQAGQDGCCTPPMLLHPVHGVDLVLGHVLRHRPSSASQWQASDYRARDSNNTDRQNRLSQDSGRKFVYHRKSSASTHICA